MDLKHRIIYKLNRFGDDFEILNLGKLQEWIDQGRINTNEIITMKTIQDCNIIGKVKNGVKLLAGVFIIYYLGC